MIGDHLLYEIMTFSCLENGCISVAPLEIDLHEGCLVVVSAYATKIQLSRPYEYACRQDR